MTTVTCGDPWIEESDVPSLASLPPADQTLVVQAATGLLFAATAGQFTGVCSDVVRPPSVNCSGMADVPVGARLSDGSLWLGGPGTNGLPPNAWASVVRLPQYPVREIVKITIDGADLPAGSWLIIDDRDVIRSNGGSWPAWQRLDRPAGQPDTWTIEYLWGNPVPPDGVIACRVLSAEIGKSLSGDQSCRLPKRLQSVTREGFSAIVVDPHAALSEWNEFGIYEVDELFVNKRNPNRLVRPAKVINVDLLGTVPVHVR